MNTNIKDRFSLLKMMLIAFSLLVLCTYPAYSHGRYYGGGYHHGYYGHGYHGYYGHGYYRGYRNVGYWGYGYPVGVGVGYYGVVGGCRWIPAHYNGYGYFVRGHRVCY